MKETFSDLIQNHRFLEVTAFNVRIIIYTQRHFPGDKNLNRRFSELKFMAVAFSAVQGAQDHDPSTDYNLYQRSQDFNTRLERKSAS